VRGPACTGRYTDEPPACTGEASQLPASVTGDDSRGLLTALAVAVVEAARATGMPELPEPHLGADLVASPDAQAQQLRAADASFDWLALTRPGASVWDEHVGVVHVGQASYDVGVHVADRLATAAVRIQRLADVLGRTTTHSGPAREHQVVARRLRLPEQQDEAIRLTLDLFEHLSRPAG
jgi:hypothetical protein